MYLIFKQVNSHLHLISSVLFSDISQQRYTGVRLRQDQSIPLNRNSYFNAIFGELCSAFVGTVWRKPLSVPAWLCFSAQKQGA